MKRSTWMMLKKKIVNFFFIKIKFPSKFFVNECFVL